MGEYMGRFGLALVKTRGELTKPISINI